MKWIKPNGQKIETNDETATIEVCEDMGWKQAGLLKKATRKKIAKKDDSIGVKVAKSSGLYN